GPPFEEERAEDEDDEERADQQRGHQVVERGVEEVGGPEDAGVDSDAGETGLHLFERGLNGVRHVECVTPRVLFDYQQQTGSAVHDRVSRERLRALDDVGDVSDAHGLAALTRDRDLSQVVRCHDRQDVLNHQPLIRSVDEPTRADPVSVREAKQSRKDGVTASTRSWTSCLTRRRSVPGLKSSSTEDSCGTDFERMMSRPSMPLSDCSSGVLTSDSTSVAVSPRQSVCTSTRGGANSGNASTGMPRNCCAPKTIKPAPAATTRNRNFRLDPTIQRIISRLPFREEVGRFRIQSS